MPEPQKATESRPDELDGTWALRLDIRPGNGVPEHLCRGLQDYVNNGQKTGDFLRAVLSNDLMLAVMRGDSQSKAGLVGIVSYIVYNLPSAAYGSIAAYEAWIERKGLAGDSNE